jgi:hypothetical protein
MLCWQQSVAPGFCGATATLPAPWHAVPLIVAVGRGARAGCAAISGAIAP